MLEVSVKLFKAEGGVSTETTEIKPKLAASPSAEEDSSTVHVEFLFSAFFRAVLWLCFIIRTRFCWAESINKKRHAKNLSSQKKISVRLRRDNFYFRCRRAVMLLRAATQLAQNYSCS